MQHIDWEQLDEGVRHAIEKRTGPVRQAFTASAGLNSELAAVLDTGGGRVFVKGLPVDHPGAVRQHREAMINPYVRPVAPRLLWHAEDAGWSLLGFEYVGGTRHADYTPGSPDLPRVVHAMNRLHALPCPDVPLKDAGQRWSAYLGDERDADLLRGDTLLHTDFNPLNILIDHQYTWIIDWAWPTRGAAFIDPACFLLRLMAHGHTAAQAEAWAAECDGWTNAAPEAITVFATANASLFTEIADLDPQPWKQHLAAAARQWADHRTAGRRATNR